MALGASDVGISHGVVSPQSALRCSGCYGRRNGLEGLTTADGFAIFAPDGQMGAYTQRSDELVNAASFYAMLPSCRVDGAYAGDVEHGKSGH